MLNLLSSLDLIQDFIGFILGIFITPLLVYASSLMFIFDTFSIWIVSMKTPFIFFESKTLESVILVSGIVFDIIIDIVGLIVSVLLSTYSLFFIALAILSIAILFKDFYHLYVLIYNYNGGDSQSI